MKKKKPGIAAFAQEAIFLISMLVPHLYFPRNDIKNKVYWKGLGERWEEVVKLWLKKKERKKEIMTGTEYFLLLLNVVKISNSCRFSASSPPDTLRFFGPNTVNFILILF